MNRFEQLDVTAFDRYFNGFEHTKSVQLYLKFANLFLKILDQKLQELTQALSTSQVEDARIISHRIRGALLSLGGNSLAQVFHDVESGVGKRPGVHFLELLHEKNKEINQFLDELRTWMETLEASLSI